MKSTSLILLLASLGLIFIQFHPGSSPTKLLPKSYRESFAWVPDGLAILEKDTVQVASFYVAKTEVTQKEYALFEAYVRSKGDTMLWNRIQVDSSAWMRLGNYMEPMVKHYHAHPAYANYPIVNISFEAAQLYCEWYEEQLKSCIQGDIDVEVTLPNRYEWLRAARGDQHYFVYAWGGPALRNAKGCSLCNYRCIGDEAITSNSDSQKLEIVAHVYTTGLAGHLSDNADILAPVESYAVNSIGLYNVNGNAKEMIATKGMACGGSWMDPGYDVRNVSVAAYEGAAPDVGFRPIIRLKKKS